MLFFFHFNAVFYYFEKLVLQISLRAPNKVKYLLSACQILQSFTEQNQRKFTKSFAFCAHVGVIKYQKTRFS